MFYKALEEYKNEGVFIKIMEEIQSMEQSYFKNECYSIPTYCEKIDEQKFRQLLKSTRILYSKKSDYDLAVDLFKEAFGNEKKCRYYRDEIDKVKNHLYAKSIDWIIKNKLSDEITDEGSYIDKITAIDEFIDDYFTKASHRVFDNMSDEDIELSDLLAPAYRDIMLEINDNVENKAVSPLTNEETIAICNYKLWETDCKNKGIFDYDRFKSKQKTLSDFKEIVNLLSFDYYLDWVTDFMKENKCLNEAILSTLPIDKIWDCVIADIIINSYIDICLWNDGNEFQCSFEDLYGKFDDDFLHYVSSDTDEDITLIKDLMGDKIKLDSKIKKLSRIYDAINEINISNCITKFFNNIPTNMKNKKSEGMPDLAIPMMFALVMYKHSFVRLKSTASDVSIEKLCKCINCYTKTASRYTSVQEIGKRDIYDAQCFIETYLLNLIYNVYSIVKYSSCNFATDELRNSYRQKLDCNKYILTYQKLCSLQKNIDVNIIDFMNNDILTEYTNIITYILTLIRTSSIDSYQKIIDSYKLYLIKDDQSPINLIPQKIKMKDGSCDFSPADYAEIFGFEYHRAYQKRLQKSQKRKIMWKQKK